MNEETLSLCEDLEQNIADEAEAREGYFKLIRYHYDLFSKEEIRLIEVIIAEELKHTEILSEMIKKRTGILPEK